MVLNTENAMGQTKITPLKDIHGKLGAKMVPFAGWEMPYFTKQLPMNTRQFALKLVFLT